MGLWEDANPYSVSLFLTLCLPVCSAFSLCLCLGARIADKAFYQQPDADVIGYVYVCLTDHILPCTVWGPCLSTLAAQSRKGGCWEVLGPGEIPEGECFS